MGVGGGGGDHKCKSVMCMHTQLVHHLPQTKKLLGCKVIPLCGPHPLEQSARCTSHSGRYIGSFELQLNRWHDLSGLCLLHHVYSVFPHWCDQLGLCLFALWVPVFTMCTTSLSYEFQFSPCAQCSLSTPPTQFLLSPARSAGCWSLSPEF